MSKNNVRSSDVIAAELAAVRAALPPVNGMPVHVERIAATVGIDVDTCIRRIGMLASAGEAWFKDDRARLSEPPKRAETDTVERKRSRFLPPAWTPTPPPRSDRVKAQADADEEQHGDAWEGK